MEDEISRTLMLNSKPRMRRNFWILTGAPGGMSIGVLAPCRKSRRIVGHPRRRREIGTARWDFIYGLAVLFLPDFTGSRERTRTPNPTYGDWSFSKGPLGTGEHYIRRRRFGYKIQGTINTEPRTHTATHKKRRNNDKNKQKHFIHFLCLECILSM